jgi:hypothetical protein
MGRLLLVLPVVGLLERAASMPHIERIEWSADGMVVAQRRRASNSPQFDSRRQAAVARGA